jgi:hypothetical protein
MPTERDLDHERQVLLQSMESSIEALNARIARLAIGLGVALDNEAELAHLLSHQHPASPVAHERRSHSGDLDTTHLGANPDRRLAHKHEELRGLLVMRYGIETRYVDEVGVLATRQIMVAVEEHLERDGFKPGADGIHLDRLFKES